MKTWQLISLILLIPAAVAAQSTPPRKDIPTIAKAANGAVVSIIMYDKDGHGIAQGSGFVVSKDGRIVTNYHVIKTGSSALVKLPDGAFFAVDGMLAFKKERDIAIIKAHGENFRTVTLGDSNRVQVGEEIIAIGNPLSLESTVSNGIVSAVRTIAEAGGKLLQITAPISPGSSGGPLFNMNGEVIGITSSAIREGENLNFAIPIDEVKPLLLAKPKVSRVPNERESPSQTENEQGSDVDLKTALHWIEVISDDSGWRPSTWPRAWGALYIRERNSISPGKQCSVMTIDKWFVLKNEADPLSDDTVLDNTTSATFNLTDIDPSRIRTQATHVDGFPVWNVYLARTDDMDKIEETRESKDGRRSTTFTKSVGLNFQNEESATRFAKALRHAVELCGGKAAPF